MPKKMKKQMMDMKPKKKEDPYKNTDHQTVILNKHDIKIRNEANKDYSKQLNKVAGGRHGVYLGNNASDRKGTISRLWGYIGQYKTGMIIIVIAMVIQSLLSVMLPMLFATAIDDYILVYDFSGAYKIGAIIVVIAILTSLIRFAGRYIMTIVAQKTVAKIRKDAFDKLQQLPVSYYDKNQSGDIVSRITNDVDLISNVLAQFVLEVITSVITLVGALIAMFIVNWALAFVVLVFVPIMVIFTAKIGKITKKGFIKQQKYLGNLNGIVEESVSGIKNIKLYSSEEEVIAEFEEVNQNLRDAGYKAQVAAGMIMPIINFLNNFIYVLITVIGGFLSITGRIAVSVGNISAITQYARMFIQPISNLAQLFNTLQQGLAGAERVFTLIDMPTEYIDEENLYLQSLELKANNLSIQANPNSTQEEKDVATQNLIDVNNRLELQKKNVKFKGHVQFKDVTFGYEADKIVLKGISFEAEVGKTVAIVGPTGSGKTTIINLMNRFYDVDQGQILIDDKPINEYRKDNLRKNIGVVLQDTKLFIGTVYDNIIYGNLDATKEEVIAAAKLANAHDFIVRLSHGYDSEVYEEGTNFSQGERQLISIARTILSDPDILILDEATSNVDTRTEFKIQESMKTLMKGRTSFVIAHRLQTIRNASKIIVIKDGTLIESGNHHELLNEKGFYHDLYTTQFKDLILEEE